MKVLADLHHGILWEALAILFEDRFGWELRAWRDGIYVNADQHHSDFPPRRITVESDPVAWLPDIVIATVSTDRVPMRRLARAVGALYVDQTGNAWDEPIGDVVLRSMVLPDDPGVLYHPEFHRVRWTKPSGHRVGVFHGTFPGLYCYADWARMATADWTIYGTIDSLLKPFEVAHARASCVGTWVCKDADGYGFAVHEAFASGRVIIGHASHYAGQLAEPLFIRGKTYLEPGDDIAAALADPVPWGRAARERFNEVVDFDAEADAIAAYLAAAR